MMQRYQNSADSGNPTTYGKGVKTKSKGLIGELYFVLKYLKKACFLKQGREISNAFSILDYSYNDCARLQIWTSIKSFTRRLRAYAKEACNHIPISVHS